MTARQKNCTQRVLRVGPVLLLLFGCAPSGAVGQGVASYEFSTAAGDEILSLGSYGGAGRLVPQYRLFGDGRLVREIQNKAGREVVSSDEMYVPAGDVGLLMQLVVEAQLAELTAEGMEAALGGQPIQMKDGETVVLQLRFDSYQRPGEEAQALFTPLVKMHAPALQARFFPQAPEPQGLVALRDALDAYFPQTAAEVIYGAPQEGGGQ